MAALKEGQHVWVSGEVKYGGRYYQVDCKGEVLQNNKGNYALCTLDRVDGDGGVTIFVAKKYIKGLPEAYKPESKNTGEVHG